MQITQQRYYTPEEYLELEEESEGKSEYIDGQIIPIAGGTTNHNQIALNFSIELGIALTSVPFQISLIDLYNKVEFGVVEPEAVDTGHDA